MALRTVGYEGEGRLRRAIKVDEGPAAAGSVDGISALGRISALGVRGLVAPADGSGAVERRQATEEQRAAWAAEEAAERTPIAPRPDRAMNAHRQPAPATAPSPPPEEDPVVEPVAPVVMREPVIPCPSCAHEPVCRIRAELPHATVLQGRLELPPAIRVTLECDFFLPARRPADEPQEGVTQPDPAPTSAKADAGRLGGKRSGQARRPDASTPLTDAQARVLEAVRRHGGNMAHAARELETDTGTVRQTIIRIRETDRLPDDVRAMVDARARGPRKPKS